MANQITIDIGAAANDGTGDPLRTAFNYVNNNFSNVWNTGLPNSNVQFSDNRILTVNTNANLVLAPNGIGKVASNVDIVPNTANVFSLGSPTRRWNTVYAQYLDVSNTTTFGDLTVDGNLTVQGNTIQIGNIVTDTKTIQLANTASTTSAANGSGITVGASDNIATLLYNSTSNAWTTNIGVSVTGNITGNYILGNGAFLTGITAGSNYSNANVAAYLPTYSGNISAGNVLVTNAISAHDVYADAGSFSGDPVTGDGSLYVGAPNFVPLGTDVMAQFTGNITNYGQLNFQNYSNSATASGDYVITADNGNDTTHFINMGMTSSTWDGTQTNVLTGLNPNNGYLYVQDGNLTLGTRAGNVSYSWKFDTTGNLTVAGNIIPTGNNTQSLGSATRQWNDLYLSNATIFMNSVPISLTAGNVLTVNDNAVLTNNSNTTVSTTGNITANTFFGTSLNSQANGSVRLRAYGSAANLVAGLAVFGEDGEVDRVQISTYNPGIDDNNAWVFNTSGDLTTPDGNIFFGTGANSAVIVPAGNSVKIAADRGNTSKNYIDITSSGITIDALGGSTADIRIRAADDIFVQGGDKTSAPGQRGGDISIDGGQGGPDNGVNAGDGGNIDIQGGDGGDILAGGSGDGGDVTLLGGTGSTANVANLLGAGRGGLVVIQGGQGGDQAGNTSLSERGGNVDIYGGQGSFDFANTLPSGLPGHVNLYGGNWGFVNAPSGNIYLNTYDGTNFKTLTYDTAGNVTMASGGSLNFVGSSSGIVQSPNNDLIVTVQDDDNDDWALYNRITDTGATLGETRLRRGDFRIDFPGVSKTFTFDDSGILSLPGDIASSTQGGDISLYAIDDGDSGSAEIKTISFAGSTLGSNVRVTQSAATISTSNAAYTWTFDNTGNLTVPGNTIVSTANATGGLGGKNISITAGASDAVTWNSNPGGNVNITGGYGSFGDGGGGPGGNVNITSGGSSDSHAGNVTINSGANAWNFDYTGNLTAPGNVTATNFVGNGAALTNVATQVTGSWTLAAGTNTANITVPPNGTYTIWVNGNIPNGIAVWNATVTVTNNNVPVIGQQFAWNYSGNALVITSIPSQIIGTAGAISNASPGVGTTTNVFEFSIDNNSGNSAVVNYGYTKL